MAVFTKFVKLYRRLTTKKNITTGLLLMATLSLVGIGLSARHSSAAIVRDCGPEVNGVHNSIANNPDSGGGCGAMSAGEVITDIHNGNPDDQAEAYAAFGLTPDVYDDFAAHAVLGLSQTNGDLVVGDQVVMTGTSSIGRVHFGFASPFSAVPGTFISKNTDVQQSDIPTWVLFDGNGQVKTAVMADCGNPTKGNQVPTNAACKMLNQQAVDGKANTFTFTTTVDKTDNVQIVKLEYFIDEGSGPVLFDTETNPDAPTPAKTFTQDATVSVKVTVKFPGGGEKALEIVEKCTKKITVAKPVVFQRCKALNMSTLDEANRKFRFTVITDQSAGVVVQSANFSVDNKVVVTNVTTKDAEGNIFWDNTFDNNSHTVNAVVNFLVDGKVVQSTETCQAQVPAKNAPVTPTPTPTPSVPLPSTGPADIFRVFAGASAVGTIGHQIFTRRRKL